MQGELHDLSEKEQHILMYSNTRQFMKEQRIHKHVDHMNKVKANCQRRLNLSFKETLS